MARIRTIKPEFPQSESMGRVSRDARLCFVNLFTIVDDAGRTRGSSRLLASLLYPYDEDAGSLMGGWLDELERETCIARYEAEGNCYLQISNWLKHQKIDKPSTSRLPAFVESSRILANVSEASGTYLVPVPSTEDLVPRSKAVSKPSASHPEASLSGDNVKGPQLVSVNPKKSRQQKPELGPERSYSPQFLAAYQRYPKQVEKASSEEEWLKALRRLQKGEKDKPAMTEVAAMAYLEDAAADHAKKVGDTEKKYVSSMRKWLNQKTYLDYEPKAKVEYVEVDPATWWEGEKDA